MYEIEFIKKDGSLRKMKCEILGWKDRSKGLVLVEEIGVGFRSFYLNSVRRVKHVKNIS
jgi:hypothetical protein